MSSQYHLYELEVAQNRSHPAHILPPPSAPSERVLDIGCGAGQTLIAAYPDRISFGIDIDIEALKLGSSLTTEVFFTCGRAELLPYAGEQFDLVVSRIALPYTNIEASLKEIRRVLRPGGRLWITLFPFSYEWNSAKARHSVRKLFFVYVLVNSLSFHLFQKQFSVFGRHESFQTERGIVRALRRTGFGQISITRNRHFLVTALAV
jgi:SAM-dependent methyltransferase